MRFVNFKVEFTVDEWLRWAESASIDGRCQNFAAYYAEQLFRNDGVSAINARSYTTFCNTISGIKDWDKSESLGMILNISKGCFDDEDNKVGKLFTTFVNMKLDKLVEPKKMLSGKWETVQQEIHDCVYTSDGKYKAEIAAVLSTRLTNYIIKLFNTPKGVKTEDVCTRILDFVEDSADKKTRLFSDDIIFNICKTLVSQFPSRTTKLLMDKRVRAKLM